MLAHEKIDVAAYIYDGARTTAVLSHIVREHTILVVGIGVGDGPQITRRVVPVIHPGRVGETRAIEGVSEPNIGAVEHDLISSTMSVLKRPTREVHRASASQYCRPRVVRVACFDDRLSCESIPFGNVTRQPTELLGECYPNLTHTGAWSGKKNRPGEFLKALSRWF